MTAQASQRVAQADGTASLWEQLIGFALERPAASLPDDVLRKGCERIVDTVGCALAGASSGEGLAANRVVCAEAASGSSSVWVSGGTMRPAATASLANGTLAHAIDFDDTHAASTLHPGVIVVPTAIAVGEEMGASGPDVLAAVAIGYEIVARLGMLMPGRFQAQGLHPTAILGIFGATAAAARLTGASRDVAIHAGGIAGSFASGLMEYLSDGSDVKQLHAGWMAQGAIRAVQFAAQGVTGPRTVLEGTKGVFRAFVSQAVDANAVLAGLGEEWVGVEVATKPYAACHAVHACIDSWHLIRERHGLRASDAGAIRRATALVPKFYLQLAGEPLEQKRRPRSVYEARFSLPFAIASAVVDGKVDLDTFSSERLDDARVLDMAARVDHEVVEFATFPGDYPGGLRVEMNDGRVFEAHLDYNVGSSHNPLPAARLTGKVHEASRRLGRDAAGTMLVESLEALRDTGSTLRDFTAAMARFGPV